MKHNGKARSASIKDNMFSIDYIDWNVDPFKDFYRFANGRWIKSHKLPSDKTDLCSFTMLQELNIARLHSIVEQCRSMKRRSTEEKLVGNFYSSYMDLKGIEKRKFAPIKHIVDYVMDLDKKEDIPELVAYLHENRVTTFLGLFSDSDKKNSIVYALYIWEQGINLPDRSYYFEKRFENIRLEYRKHIAKMLSLYGFKNGTEMAESIINIETMLAKAMLKPEEERDEIKNYNKMSVKELEKYKNLNIPLILNKLGAANPEYVIVGQPSFIKSVDLILKNSNIEELKAYFIWCTINSYASLLHKHAVYEHFRFYGKVLSGQKKIEPRWKRGLYRTNSMIGDAIDSLYVKSYFNNYIKGNAAKLLEMIKESFRKRLETNKWMTDETKRLALEKLDAMEFKIGYPKRFKNYAGLTIDRHDLVGNVIRAHKFELNRQLARIGKQVDKEEWSMNASEVNAYYDNSKNQVVIPAGILQPPFFDVHADLAVNLGGIGGIIGHEITHGFDDQGRLFDKNGNIKNWWTKNDMKRFTKLSRNIEELYSSISVLPGLKINGKLTIGENIADLGGISIAYDALKAEGSLDKRIGKLNEEQRYFIAWAQTWKSVVAKEMAELRIYVDPHPPESVRGLIPVVSHPSFESAFKPLSKMKKPKLRYKDVNLW
ncbi:MAG: M13 family metallopeptidase [Candidatus Micrarchaeia archaeon]